MATACTCKESNSLAQNLEVCVQCRQAHAAHLQMQFAPPAAVHNGLWIGSVQSSVKEDQLSKLNIQLVLIASQECCLNFFESIKYQRMPLQSQEQSALSHLDTIADCIAKGLSEMPTADVGMASSTEPELARKAGVRCGVLVVDTERGTKAGVAVAGYLIKSRKKTAEDACRAIEEKAKFKFSQEYKDQLKDFELKVNKAESREEEKSSSAVAVGDKSKKLSEKKKIENSTAIAGRDGKDVEMSDIRKDVQKNESDKEDEGKKEKDEKDKKQSMQADSNKEEIKADAKNKQQSNETKEEVREVEQVKSDGEHSSDKDSKVRHCNKT